MARSDTISEKLKITIINYLTGKWDECDANELNQWLEESNDNKRLFQQLVDLWEISRIGGDEKKFDAGRAWQRFELKNKPAVALNLKTAVRKIAVYAAVFVLAFVIGVALHSRLQSNAGHIGPPHQVVEYTVPYGSKTSVKLLDGSFVWLNAGTILKYDRGFGVNNRNIELSGEACFEVAKDESLPFVVNTGQISVTALGTKFNVKAYPEENNVGTALLEGRVKLRGRVNEKSKDIILESGEKADYNIDNQNFSISKMTSDYEVTWYTDRWTIKNMRMEEFSKLLERRYNIEFTFKEERIKDYQFAGVIRDETIEQILTAITYTAPVKYTITNNHIVLSTDERKLKSYESLLK